jgi:hypothetical protein
MLQRSMRPWLWTVFVVMAVGMTACSGVPRSPVLSFEAPFAGHPSGMATVGEGHDPSQPALSVAPGRQAAGIADAT